MKAKLITGGFLAGIATSALALTIQGAPIGPNLGIAGASAAISAWLITTAK